VDSQLPVVCEGFSSPVCEIGCRITVNGQLNTKFVMKRFRRIYYDYFSHVYDRFVSLHSPDRGSRLRYFLAEKTGLSKGDKVLDICTGTGTLLSYLKAKLQGHGLVVGADFSMGMLKAGRPKRPDHDSVFLVLADAACLPFGDKVFDAVTCSHAFYELKGDTQDRCLHEICRVLKPGKLFLMMEHDVPENFLLKMLFYGRLLSMGPWKALEILRHEMDLLTRYFRSVERVQTPTGRSKVMICRA
jgi:ubiquinone/menaquinone biosynthesis C-methylase UbiE